MHDFLIAKDIVSDLLKIVEEKKIEDITAVDLEIGMITLSHDGLPEHTEDVSVDSLMFGLEGVSKDTVLDGVKFNIKKVEGHNWKIANIVVK
ncbi:hypothetical protein ACFL08_01130 [Patescibacteria group bacterium]